MAQLNKRLVIEALRKKADPVFAKKDDYGGIAYEGKDGIYFWARKYFPQYTIGLYPTNEKLVSAWIRDFNNREPNLLKQLVPGTEVQEGQLPPDQTTQQTGSEQTSPVSAGVARGEAPSTMSSASHGPSFHLPVTPGTSVTLNKPAVETAISKSPLTEADKTSAIEEAQRIVTTKTAVPEAFTKAFENEPEHERGSSADKTSPQTTPAPQPNQSSSSVAEAPKLAFQTSPVGGVAKDAGSALQRSVAKIGSSSAGGLGKLLSNLGTTAGKGLGAATPVLSKGGNGLIDFGTRLTNQTSRIGGPSLVAPKKRVWLWAFGIFMFLFVGLSLFSSISDPGSQTPSTGASPLIGGGGDINSCSFTRSGSSFTIKSSKLAGLISGVAAKTGVPAQVLASVAMHENPGFVVNKTDDSEEIKNNNFCNRGPSFCEKNGQVLHSKAYTTGEDDPCTSAEIVEGARTAQAIGLMQILDIYNPGRDLCNITESLTIAAEKLKASGLTQLPTQEQITVAIQGYHNSCLYGSFNYCDEVWKDLQNCQPSSFAGGGLVVPTGQGGERIANMARQIAQQLVHSTKPEDAEKRAQLAQAGIACNPGGSAGPSYHCWIGMGNQTNQPYDQASDPDYLQCTEFVWATFAEAGYSAQIDKIRGNDAFNWPEAAAKNPELFAVFDNPNELQPGDIISLGLGSGGIAQHVSVVISKTENTVEVAQASTAQPTETYSIKNGSLQIVNPTNARCTKETNPGCRVNFIRLK